MRRHTWTALPGVVLLALVTAACGQTDGGISTAVRAQLAADESVPAEDINVETNDGVVRLTGTVETQVARDRAVEIARETRGVRDVVDELQLTPAAAPTTGVSGAPRLDDAEAGVRTTDPQWREEGAPAEERAGDAAVTTAVRTALMEDRTLSERSIMVSTRDNVVTLTGRVESEGEKKRALELTRELQGVRSVVDRLTIKPN